MEHRVFRIMSVHNAAVKEAVEITSKRSEYRNRAFLIEGTNLVEAALEASRAKVSRLFYTEAYLNRQGQKAEILLELAARRGAGIFEVVTSVMERLCDTETPQGIAAMASCETLPLASIEVEAGPMVISDGISDPGNMGALIRAADAAGAAAVIILEESCDAFSPKALRASAGSIFNVPLVYETREALPAALKARGVRLLVTSSKTGSHIYEVGMKPPVAMVFGAEAGGVSDALMGASEATVRIPMRGMAESLNVAASAAVCLYECVRQMSMPAVEHAARPRSIEAGGLTPPGFNRRTALERRTPPQRRQQGERRDRAETPQGAQPRDYRDQRGRRDQRDKREQRDQRERPVEQWPRKERSWGEGSWEDARPARKTAVRGKFEGPKSFDRPRTGQSRTDRPQTSRPQTGRPQTGRPQTGRPQTGRPQTGRPQTGRPQTGRPQTGRPYGDKPYGDRPYSERPHSGRPYGDRPQGERSWSERQRSERSGSERPGGVRRPTSGIERKGPGSPGSSGPRSGGTKSSGPRSGPRGAGGPKGGGRKKY